MSNYLHALRGRNIPAYAGRTSAAWRSNNKPQKHPRIRGENRSGRIALRAATEASPHTRGKQRHAQCAFRECRNIPAYAGKAISEDFHLETIQKHPRIRGESRLNILKVCRLIETSPHTRGKRLKGLPNSRTGRNIPAYAGKASPETSQQTPKWKHPRIRGESSVRTLGTPDAPETSPHTRGKPHET